MDGIGKKQVDQDTDAKPGSLNLYMSGNFSAFTFCLNEKEEKIKRNGSLLESSEGLNNKFLKGKIQVQDVDASDSLSESSRRDAALNRALISGLESVCIERPQSSFKRKFFTNTTPVRAIQNPVKAKRASSVDQNVFDIESDMKETREMGT